MIDPDHVERIVEAALLAADGPVSIARLANLFTADELGERNAQTMVRTALDTLRHRTAGRGYELVRVASGFRFQVRQEFGPWVSRLFDERPPRYSRALLETLALIVHRQPVTRGDIEQVRGVAVSSSIMRTLSERGWVQAVGQRETPGRPTLYGTTRRFLDDFNLASLDELPPLDELQSFVATPDTEDAQGEETAGADRAAPNAGDARPLAEVVQLPIADQ